MALLYGHPDQAFYLRQLVRQLGSGLGAVQREVKELTAAGVITRSVTGNQVFYQANLNSPIFSELRALIAKTVGAADALRSALVKLQDRIKIAFIYGSVARSEERSGSDLDLMVVGDVSYAEVADSVRMAQESLAREINPSVYSAQEFLLKKTSKSHFITSVLAQKKIFVIGSEDELEKLGDS